MNQKGFVNIVLVVVIIVILAGAVGYLAFVKKSEPAAQPSPTPTPTQTQKPVSPIPTRTETKYAIDGIEDGGYSGTAFCSLVNYSRFELGDHSITIDSKGPYTIKINEMRIPFSSYEYPNVKLVMHLRFENKENSYADTLYFGNDDNLYNCHGGK